MATYIGPDLSVHNGSVNMSSVKAAGNTFVILREGYGDVLSYPKQKDSTFENNYKNAKAAGLWVGAYHYMYATTVAGAKREAEGFLANIKGKTFEMPVCLDVEEASQYNLPNSTVEGMIKAFIDVLEKAGYYVALYSYESFLTSKTSASFRSAYDVWCANTARTPSITYGIHQYTFTARVNGINGNVDMNRTAKDYKSIMTNNGLNGFKKPAAPTTEKVLDTTGLKRNDKNSLAVLAYKQLLLLAYYKKYVSKKVANDAGFGEGTEVDTNELLKRFGYKQTGIAGENLIKKLGALLGVK